MLFAATDTVRGTGLRDERVAPTVCVKGGKEEEREEGRGQREGEGGRGGGRERERERNV